MSVPPLKMFESETEGGYMCDTKRDELVAPSCAICLSQSTNNLCALSCGHVFHMLVFWHGSVPQNRVQSVPLVKNLLPVTRIS